MKRESIKEKMERQTSMKTERVWVDYTLLLLMMVMIVIMTVFTEHVPA
jgi:hypothetical protein